MARVYYAETDAGGVVYHARYLNFLERGRTEMMRDCGFDLAAHSRETGGAFVLAEANLKYKAPARLDDELIVETGVLHVGGASLKLRQKVLKRLAEGESLLLEGVIALVYVSLAEIKPMRIPDTMRQALQPYLTLKDD